MRQIVFKLVVFLFSSIQTHGSDSELYLTPYILKGELELAKNLSTVDPKALIGIRSYSGFITVKNESNSNLFFWYFPHVESSTKPFIIWLNGGPGYSSMLGLFDEIGPVQIEKNGTLTARNCTWASDYSLLFIDNPVGAGFSFTDKDNGYTTNVDQVSSQLYELLDQFLMVYPEVKGAPLFIAGQSYAGKYVPAFAVEIHRMKRTDIQLKGIILGNPLIEVRGVMHYSVLTEQLGLLEGVQVAKLRELETETVRLIDQGDLLSASYKFNETIEYIKKKTLVDSYNFLRNPDSTRFDFEKIFKDEEFRKAIHVASRSFITDNQLVYQNMMADTAHSAKFLIEELLEVYGVLCYHGQLDLVCPYSLAKNVYNSLQWSRQDEYYRAARKRLRHLPDGRVVGYKKIGGNFAEVLIRNCGHRAPKEEPDVTKFIVDMFIDLYK